MGVACHDYASIMRRMNVLTLEQRRNIADINFIYNLFNDVMRCPTLLQLLGLNCPQRLLRSSSLLYIHAHNTLYGSNSIINRASMRVNMLPACADLFHLSPARFRSEVTRIIVELRPTNYSC